VATSVANDHFRRLHSAKRGGKVVTSPLVEEQPSGPANGEGAPAGLQKSVLLAQLDRKLRNARGAVSARDRALFWLYYGQGFTAGEIASLPSAGLSAKGVESALRRVVLWLRGEIESPRSAETALVPVRQGRLREGELPAVPLNRDRG
jgi:RNA polymerase sigma-70 factor, ECF subfamily